MVIFLLVNIKMNSNEVFPVKKEDKKDEFPYLDHTFPTPSFLMNIVAPKSSGKSVLANSIIYNFYYKSFHPDKCDNLIVYISPNLGGSDPNLRFIEKDESIIKISENLGDGGLDQIIETIIEDQDKIDPEDRPYLLLILDDCLPFFGSNFTTLAKLGSYNRHKRISLIVISQSFRKIPQILRYNADSWVLFRTYNEQEVDKFLEEFGGAFPDFLTHYKNSCNKKYNFLYVDTKRQKLYHNFTKLLWSREDQSNIPEPTKKG